jgi:hypothetical protein
VPSPLGRGAWRAPSVTGLITRGTEGVAMWKDLAALVPPLTVAAVFLAGVFWVVRREMGGKRRREDAPEKRKPGR